MRERVTNAASVRTKQVVEKKQKGWKVVSAWLGGRGETRAIALEVCVESLAGRPGLDWRVDGTPTGRAGAVCLGSGLLTACQSLLGQKVSLRFWVARRAKGKKSVGWFRREEHERGRIRGADFSEPV